MWLPIQMVSKALFRIMSFFLFWPPRLTLALTLAIHPRPAKTRKKLAGNFATLFCTTVSTAISVFHFEYKRGNKASHMINVHMGRLNSNFTNLKDDMQHQVVKLSTWACVCKSTQHNVHSIQYSKYRVCWIIVNEGECKCQTCKWSTGYFICRQKLLIFTCI